ncbi:MAG TPA: hypothetical protein VIK04_07495 [Solirubrobacteraceae bacterium]
MNPQLTASLMQARQFDLQRGAERARIVGEIPSRRNPVTKMLRSIPASRLNFRVLRTDSASWNAIDQA